MKILTAKITAVLIALMLVVAVICIMHIDIVCGETPARDPEAELAMKPFAPAIASEAEETETEPELVSLGEFKIYHYCPCAKCCGKTNGITATGTQAEAGRTIAADWDVIPAGTEVVIGGEAYTVEDRGGGINGRVIDIYMDSHQAALEAGTYTTEVFVEGGSQERIKEART